MDAQTERATPANGAGAAPPPAEPAPTAASEGALWIAVGALYRRWRLIALVTAVAALGAILVALALPRYYAAEARVLRPEGGGVSALLGLATGGGGGLSDFLSGGGGFTRYLSILTSRTLLEDVVEEFDLVRVYDLEDEDEPLPAALGELAANVEFDVALDYEYLAVRAFDRDPERAAAMANFMVDRLNAINMRLSSEDARQTRLYIEGRLTEARSDLDSVRTVLQAFQEEHGVVELESQAEAFMGSMAELRSEVARAEVRYQTLARQFGPENPQARAARDALESARAQERAALGGQDALLPFSLRELPALAREYTELVQAQLVQGQVIETVYPLYEQALFQERNEAAAVQVLDPAVPPVQPARPSRRLVVVAVTLTGFLLAFLFVLGSTWWRRSHEALVSRLYAATAADAGRPGGPLP